MMQTYKSITTPTQVVVLGAGYAGLLATLRLARLTRRQPVQITLINASATFMERTRLHQRASGQPIKLWPMAELLSGTRVRFIQGKVTALHPGARQITVQDEAGQKDVGYDHLLYALGSHTTLAQLPGATEFAYAVEQHSAIVQQLGQLASGAQILVIGAGLTGIEAATELAESHPHLGVTLATNGALGADLSAAGARHLTQTVQKLGIAVRQQTKIVRLESGQARTSNGEVIPFDLCLYTAGFAVSPLAAAAGLAVNAKGQVIVDALLHSVSHPAIYAIGDAATFAPEGGLNLRMACATAMPMAAHAAENLVRMLTGKPEEPFRFGYAVRCISLGRANGLVQLVDATDQPRPWVLSGRLGAWVKERILNYTIWSLRLERHFGFYNWPQTNAVRASHPASATSFSVKMLQG
jgi:NADH dehydrogenase FAD-containing subunit